MCEYKAHNWHDDWLYASVRVLNNKKYLELHTNSSLCFIKAGQGVILISVVIMVGKQAYKYFCSVMQCLSFR